MSSRSSVLSTVVAKGNCIGCGMCAALCRHGALRVAMDRRGFLAAQATEAECVACGRCLEACPFAPEATREDEISEALFGRSPSVRRDPVLGLWRSTYLGHRRSDASRLRASSGGVTTALLKGLLEHRIVERVAHVVPVDDGSRLFDYRLSTDVDSIEAGSHSAYYPTTMQDVLRRVMADPAPTAFVTLPCFAKALRLGAARSRALGQSVSVVVGLVCGQVTGTCMVEYLASRAHIPMQDVRRVDFRVKGAADRNAQDFGIAIHGSSGPVGLRWVEDMALPWSAGAFCAQACMFCDDVFAECADVTFMDAWLPECVEDTRGTNLVLTRSEDIDSLLRESAQDLDIALEPAAPERVLLSQAAVIEKKRDALVYRLRAAGSLGLDAPRKRTRPAPAGTICKRYVWSRIWRFSRDSVDVWHSTGDHRSFDRIMRRRVGRALGLRRLLSRLGALTRLLGQ